MKAPILENNQHSVLAAEFNTGIVLTTDFKRHIGNEEIFHIFQTYESALEFVDKKLSEETNIELSIFNSKGEYLVTKDPRGTK